MLVYQASANPPLFESHKLTKYPCQLSGANDQHLPFSPYHIGRLLARSGLTRRASGERRFRWLSAMKHLNRGSQLSVDL